MLYLFFGFYIFMFYSKEKSPWIFADLCFQMDRLPENSCALKQIEHGTIDDHCTMKFFFFKKGKNISKHFLVSSGFVFHFYIHLSLIVFDCLCPRLGKTTWDFLLHISVPLVLIEGCPVGICGTSTRMNLWWTCDVDGEDKWRSHTKSVASGTPKIESLHMFITESLQIPWICYSEYSTNDFLSSKPTDSDCPNDCKPTALFGKPFV